MSNGVMMASAGMRAQMEALDVLANNLANINTPGFKEQKSFFAVLQESIKPPAGLDIGEVQASSRIAQASAVLNMQDGVLQSTQRELDIALVGKGFLAVQTPRGERYTRNGSLSINRRAELATADGMPLAGESGPIVVGPGKIQITEDGDVYVNSTRAGRLKIVTFDLPSRLACEGASLLAAADAKIQAGAPACSVRQGYLEQSNVNAVGAAVEMVSIMRRFEAIQKSLHSLEDDLNAKSIEKLGR